VVVVHPEFSFLRAKFKIAVTGAEPIAPPSRRMTSACM